MEISSIDLFFPSKGFLITTLDGQVYLMNSKFMLKNLKLEKEDKDEPSSVSECLIFQPKAQVEEYKLCLGFTSGQFMLEDWLGFLKKKTIKASDSMISLAQLQHKITCITYLEVLSLLAIGTNKGEFLTYNVAK